VPDPVLLQGGVQPGPAVRPPLPARLHRQVCRPVRGADLRRGPPGDGRGVLRLHGWADRTVRAPPGAGDEAGFDRAGLRTCRPVARRSGRPDEGGGEERRGAPDGTNADVFAMAADELEASMQVFHVRDGRIRGQRGWVTERVEAVTEAELV